MDTLIAQILKDFTLDDYRPIVPRSLNLEQPLEPRAGNLAIVIIGVRRCGKTYRLFQQMDALLAQGVSPERMLYFNFEDSRISPATSQTGDAVLQTYRQMYPEAFDQGVYLFFDEIQEMDGWDRWLRRVIDTTRATIYVTGSSSKLLSEEVASAFRGRSVAYELSPYSFREYVLASGLEVSSLTSVKGEERNESRLVLSSAEAARAQALFVSYLQQGGFPAVCSVSEQRAVRVLQGYAQRVVAKDVIERHNLSNPQAVTAFAQRVLASSGRGLSVRKAENTLKSQGIAVSRNFLSQVLAYFEDAFLVASVHEFSRSLSAVSNKSCKVYAVDQGLALANSSAATQDAGQRLETLVYNELRRRCAYGRPGSVSTYRTTKGAYEVDFIVGDAVLQQSFELYQVCLDVSSDATRAREVRALNAAMAECGLGEGFLLVGEGSVEDIAVESGTVHQLPVWLWALAGA